jgi:nucleoside-diphosphate-sugar epimerase
MPVLDERSANPGNRIHVDDLVQCCVAALSAEAPAGIYNVGDGDHRSSHWFSNEVARQLGLPAPPEISMADARQQFSPQRLSFMSESRIVDTTKMREVLGVTPRYADLEDGIRASL